MYSSFRIAQKFLRYYLTASNSRGHGMHSPFVFDFINHVLQNRHHYQPPASIEALRNELQKDKTKLELEDMGAGSRTGARKERSVQQIASSAVKPKKFGQLLYRLARHYQPLAIVELGTSLGISTAYLAAAHPQARVITIEGSAEVHRKAQDSFRALKLENIQSLNGNFDDLLPPLLESLQQVDLGYIDGNHRREPTLRYFELFLQKSVPSTILVFDDIHWSAEMEAAWESIQGHPSVRCTVDLFFMGFVFFNPSFKTRQHFRIRY